MNRNEFIKTLVLGTGVLSAGVSLAETKTKPEPKTHFTLLELMNIHGCKITVERIGGFTSQLSVMLVIFEKRQFIQQVKSIEGLPEVMTDQWGTVHVWFNTREELKESMLNVRKHMTENNIDWKDRNKADLFSDDVQRYMGNPDINNVLGFKYRKEDGFDNTYIVTNVDPCRIHHSINPITNIATRYI